MKKKIGGFAIEFSKRGKSEFFRAESISGNWSMTLNQNNEMFHLLKYMWDLGHEIEDTQIAENHINYVAHYVRTNYICSSVVPDEQFTEEFVKIYNDYCQRVAEVRGVKTDESEEEILKGEMMKHQKRIEYERGEGKHSTDDSEVVGKDTAL